MKKISLLVVVCVGISAGVRAEPVATAWWQNKWVWAGIAGATLAGLSWWLWKRPQKEKGVVKKLPSLEVQVPNNSEENPPAGFIKVTLSESALQKSVTLKDLWDTTKPEGSEVSPAFFIPSSYENAWKQVYDLMAQRATLDYQSHWLKKAVAFNTQMLVSIITMINFFDIEVEYVQASLINLVMQNIIEYKKQLSFSSWLSKSDMKEVFDSMEKEGVPRDLVNKYARNRPFAIPNLKLDDPSYPRMQAITPDAQKIVFSFNSSSYLWDFQLGYIACSFPDSHNDFSCALSDNARYILQITSSNKLLLFDNNCKPTATIDIGHFESNLNWKPFISGDEKYVIAIQNNAVDKGIKLLVYDIKNKSSNTLEANPIVRNVSPCITSKNNRIIVPSRTEHDGASSAAINFYDVTNASLILSKESKVLDDFSVLRLSKDEQYVALYAKKKDDQNIEIFDTKTGDSVRLSSIALYRENPSIFWFNKKNYILTCDSAAHKGILKVWDAKTGLQKSVLNPSAEGELSSRVIDVTAAALSSDDKWMAVANGNTVTVWDIDDLEKVKKVHTLKVGERSVRDIIIDPFNQLIMTASGDTVKIWSVMSGKLINTLSVKGVTINKLYMTSTGSHLIADCGNKTVFLGFTKPL